MQELLYACLNDQLPEFRRLLPVDLPRFQICLILRNQVQEFPLKILLTDIYDEGFRTETRVMLVHPEIKTIAGFTRLLLDVFGVVTGHNILMAQEFERHFRQQTPEVMLWVLNEFLITSPLAGVVRRCLPSPEQALAELQQRPDLPRGGTRLPVQACCCQVHGGFAEQPGTQIFIGKLSRLAYSRHRG